MLRPGQCHPVPETPHGQGPRGQGHSAGQNQPKGSATLCQATLCQATLWGTVFSLEKGVWGETSWLSAAPCKEVAARWGWALPPRDG